jgi:hypothetical protein
MTNPVILPLTIFGPIAWWVAAVEAKSVCLDKEEIFKRQTFRNRIKIVGPNSEQTLTFPVSFAKGSGIKDVLLTYNEKWPLLHRRSLQSAYGKAPYYEYFSSHIDDFFNHYDHLLMNKCMDSLYWVNRILCLNVEFVTTANKDYSTQNSYDFEKPMPYKRYRQVFEERHSFYSNVSILDLIFNLGPGTREYLMNQIGQTDTVASSTKTPMFPNL